MLYISEQTLQTPRRPRKGTNRTNSASPYFSPSRQTQLTPNFGSHNLDFSVGTAPKTSNPEQTPLTRFGQANVLGSNYDLSKPLERLGQLKPPLIQERVADDPWKVLIAVTLLNKTAGKLAIPVFWSIIEKWPTPLDLAQANLDDLISIIHKLGTQTVRSKRLIQLSKVYLQEPPSMYDLRRSRASSSQRKSRFFISSNVAYPPTPISHLPGAGTYALDSYRIFCCVHNDPTSEEWKLVRPTDKELIRYLRWKWAFHEHLEWSPNKGIRGQITPKYLTSLINDIEANAIVPPLP